jgi:hypothetical protein
MNRWLSIEAANEAANVEIAVAKLNVINCFK